MVSGAYDVAIRDAKANLGNLIIDFSGVLGMHIDIAVPTSIFTAERYDFPRQQIDLITAKQVTKEMFQATLFIPQIKERTLPKKFEKYLTESGRGGRPKNQSLVDSIRGISESTVRSIWTDAPERFPSSREQIWWEVWLRATRSSNFLSIATRVGFDVAESRLVFPLTEIYYAYASVDQMDAAFRSCDALAELRAAQNSPAPKFVSGSGPTVSEVQDFASRLTAPPTDAPVVCVIDTGVNRGHPVLTQALDSSDMHHTSGPSPVDHHGHGTAMAALALHGDLNDALHQMGPVSLSHRLESVSFLHPTGWASVTDFPQFAATETTRAVSLVEVQAPTRSRIHCVATTLSDPALSTGRPTTNSATIDQLSSDPLHRRLFCISAGNVRDRDGLGDYPMANDLAGIEDPAQSWNALTIGAYTDLDTVTDPAFSRFTVVAPKGDLSPHSRTAITWSSQWPAKPDILFEGGNVMRSYALGKELKYSSELELLTADRGYPNPSVRSFSATSGATALASRFSAQLAAEEPARWPETIRGLVVHSADWTPAMEAQVSSTMRTDTLLRRYGYGVPNFNRASRSANDDCTIIFERQITPFKLAGSTVKTNELVLHELPWPKETLLQLGSQPVSLRITLSYFIEPNPGEKGYAKRFRYASHSLRFALIGENEQHASFHARINREAQRDPGVTVPSPSPRVTPDHWKFGKARDRGSIHSDILELTAAQLATRSCVAVYPMGSGWWRELKRLHRYGSRTRYSLIVSIRFAQHISTDIYTELRNQIDVETAIERN